MNSGPTSLRSTAAPRRGVALVLTLLVIAMLVVVVVGFTSVTRLEQISARNATYQSAAQQMAQLATGQAMQRLVEAVDAGVAAGMYATQSGQLLPRAADPEPLYSVGGIATNLNAFTTNGLITGNSSDNISVGLIDVAGEGGQPVGRTAFYISDETSKLPVNQAAPGRGSLNPAPPRPFSIKGVDTALPANAVTSFSNLLTTTRNQNASISNWTYFFTPEQLAAAVTFIGPVRARRVTVATETNPAFGQETPWGTPKIQINTLPPADASVDTLAAALSDPALEELFGGHFGDKYGTEGVRQLAANMLQLRSGYWSPDYVGAASTNFGAVLEDPVIGLSQISGDVSSPPASGMLKKTNGIPSSSSGYVPFPMLVEVAVGGLEYGFSGALPLGADPNMTIRFFVACKLLNPFPARYAGGGELYAQIDKARIRTVNANPLSFDPIAPPADQVWRGPDGSHRSLTPGYNDMPASGAGGIWDPWGASGGLAQERAEHPVPPGAGAPAPPIRNLIPADGVQRLAIPAMEGFSRTNLFLPFTIETSARYDSTDLYKGPNSVMYVIVDQVKLLAVTDDETSLRDWCSGPDFREAFGQPETAQFILPVPAALPRQGTFAAGGYAPSAAPPAGTVADSSRWISVVKSDPRMKAGLDARLSARAWRTNNSSLASTNLPLGSTNFLSNPIPPDAGDAQSALYSTNFPPSMPTSSGNYSSAADLGKVFTGVPWRTLRIQPQPTNEIVQEYIPDWVLLDMVDFTSGNIALSSVNPNFRYASDGALVTGFGSGLRSQLDVLTNNVASRAITDPIDPGPPVSALISATFTTNQSGLANLINAVSQPEGTNSWASGASGWRQRRTALQFPTNVMLLPSEITEIAGVANYVNVTNTPNRSEENEYRLSALLPGLGTKGRFFTIHALGQALEKGTGQPVATALLETLVEVDNSTTPATVRTLYQRPPAN